MNICVIGGSGFVGTHLIKKVKNNHEITIIDKEPNEAFSELVEQGDIRDRDFLNQSWVQTILIL
jgi:nucleoside-diphosphate-sugar epimerase